MDQLGGRLVVELARLAVGGREQSVIDLVRGQGRTVGRAVQGDGAAIGAVPKLDKIGWSRSSSSSFGRGAGKLPGGGDGAAGRWLPEKVSQGGSRGVTRLPSRGGTTMIFPHDRAPIPS